MRQIVDFILGLDKLRGVARKGRPRASIVEPAEHSWQIALLAVSLAHHAVFRGAEVAAKELAP